MAKCEYDLLKEKIVNITGIDEIVISLTNTEFIIDDNKNTLCLLHINKIHGALYVLTGSMDKLNLTIDDLKKLNFVDRESKHVEIFTTTNKNPYLEYALADTISMKELSIIPDRGLTKTEFKPRKEILKILAKLIEQFKNITHKDIKRIKTYEETLNKIKKEFEFSNEYLKTALSLNLENCYGYDYLIIEIKRIILDGKPSTKFNLTIEEFNLFKKWLFDNSKRR